MTPGRQARAILYPDVIDQGYRLKLSTTKKLHFMKKQEKNTRKYNTKKSGGKPENDKLEQGVPGYPLYPPSEDIMNRAKRIDVDVNTAIENSQPIIAVSPTEKSHKLGTGETDSDLTNDDFQALASDEVESSGDDEILANRSWPVDFAAEDLDIPGSEQDDAQEQLGSEDEENNSYSVGGDRHEDLETDRS